MKEKRLIDVDDLIDFINMGHLRNPLESCFSERDVVDMLESRPTVDAVLVVRCRDCKHCDPENHHCDHHMGTAAPLRRKHDDFCSYGERKEDDDNG